MSLYINPRYFNSLKSGKLTRLQSLRLIYLYVRRGIIHTVFTEGDGYDPNNVMSVKPIVVRHNGQCAYVRLACCVNKNDDGTLDWLDYC